MQPIFRGCGSLPDIKSRNVELLNYSIIIMCTSFAYNLGAVFIRHVRASLLLFSFALKFKWKMFRKIMHSIERS